MTKKTEIKRLLLFLLITFGIVWGIMFFYFAKGGVYGSSVCDAILTFSMLCPSIGVLCTIKLTKEQTGVAGKNSLKLGISLKNRKWIWFLVSILGTLLYMELGYLLVYLIQPQTFQKSFLDSMGISGAALALIPVSGIISGILFSVGALGEEIGWRSYLFPKLEGLIGTVGALVAGNIIWSVWHFPSIVKGHSFGLGYKGAPYTGFLVFTLSCLAMGAFLQLLVEKTGSVWPAVFAHAINNSGASILGMCMDYGKLEGAMAQSTVYLLVYSIPQILLGIISVVLLVRMRKKEKQS
ncbi:MAG: lysostaphin resistance A-like protein [Lachnospiraceae bacterium]